MKCSSCRVLKVDPYSNIVYCDITGLICDKVSCVGCGYKSPKQRQMDGQKQVKNLPEQFLFIVLSAVREFGRQMLLVLLELLLQDAKILVVDGVRYTMHRFINRQTHDVGISDLNGII